MYTDILPNCAAVHTFVPKQLCDNDNGSKCVSITRMWVNGLTKLVATQKAYTKAKEEQLPTLTDIFQKLKKPNGLASVLVDRMKNCCNKLAVCQTGLTVNYDYCPG